MTEFNVKTRILAADSGLLESVRAAARHLSPGGRRRLEILPWETEKISGAARNVFVIRTETLDKMFVSNFRSRHFENSKYLLINGSRSADRVAKCVIDLGLRDWNRLYAIEGDEGSDALALERVQRLLFRLVLGLTAEGNDRPILDAQFAANTLVVVSSDFQKLEIPIGKLRSLAGASSHALANFEIDEDGSFVYWPDLDVHLGWEQFRAALDPLASIRARQRNRAFNAALGGSIRALRKKHHLKQSEVPGLSERQTARIEAGECQATSSAVEKLAAAHHLAPTEYLAQLAAHLEMKPNGGNLTQL